MRDFLSSTESLFTQNLKKIYDGLGMTQNDDRVFIFNNDLPDRL